MRSETTIKEMAGAYFNDLFKSGGDRNFQPILDQIPSSVDADMNQQLTQPVTMEEFTTTAFQLGATKAPGPDGFNGLFFQKHWKDLNQDIFREVYQFFETGSLNPELNRTSITLIPKLPNPEKIEQFCPISLCNFIYKIISKTLTNRLKPLLPNLIEE